MQGTHWSNIENRRRSTDAWSRHFTSTLPCSFAVVVYRVPCIYMMTTSMGPMHRSVFFLPLCVSVCVSLCVSVCLCVSLCVCGCICLHLCLCFSVLCLDLCMWLYVCMSGCECMTSLFAGMHTLYPKNKLRVLFGHVLEYWRLWVWKP